METVVGGISVFTEKVNYFLMTFPWAFLIWRFLSFSSSFFCSEALSLLRRSSSARFLAAAFFSSSSSLRSASASFWICSSSSSRDLRSFVRVSGRSVNLGDSTASMKAKMDLMRVMVMWDADGGGARRERITWRSRLSAGIGLRGRSRGWSVI